MIAIFPIPAREVNNIVLPPGNNLAELLFNPFIEIFLLLEFTNILLPISVGEYQFIFPFQYYFILVEGVPPPIILATSFNLRCSQSNRDIIIILFIFHHVYKY